MESKEIKLAVLDMYEGTQNLGLQNILSIVNLFEGEVTCEVFDVRGKANIPGPDHDIYIFTGGPGSPLEGDQVWLQPFYHLIDGLWQHNKYDKGSKKYCFFICHSFQMACHHFGLGQITRRKEKSFGTFPVYKTNEGREEWLFHELSNPFWVADFREYQVTDPDFAKMQALGATLLLIETERELPDQKRAMMAIRFSEEMIGTQFHPEADPNGMRKYFTDQERVIAILEEFGKTKLTSMVTDLNHPQKIERTHKIILPFFLHRAINGIRKNSLVLA